MNKLVQYYPNDGQYVPIPGTIYAQYYGNCPNPCRKYHVSSDLPSAIKIADTVLPYLSSKKIFHKVVKNLSDFTMQNSGDQAGKFITIYLPAYLEQRNNFI